MTNGERKDGRGVLETVRRRVARSLKEHGLHRGPALLAAVSGGPDSVCLLDALASLESRPSIVVAHVNHQLRGAASEGDEAYVRALCDRLRVPFECVRVDVTRYRKQKRVSLEDAARRLRHQALADVAHRTGATAVVLGHTADDQAETVLLHLLRGTGLPGLAGMPSFGQGIAGVPVCRPLLATTRAETRAYCAEAGLEPRQDESNLSTEFTRNRVRAQLMPLLSVFNPRALETLGRLAGNAREAVAYLDQEVERHWRTVVSDEGTLRHIHRPRLLELHPGLQAHLLRRAAGETRGGLQGLTARHIHSLRALAAGPTGRHLALPGLDVEAGYDMLTLAPRERVVGHRGTTSGRSLRSTAVEPAGPSQAAKITVPGTTFFDGWSVQAAVRSGVSGAPGDPLVAWMDPALAQGPLWVRHRRPGDRLQPLGFPGTRKLQDILVDAKVPRQARDAVPLLCQGDAILWVVGHRLAEAARVPDGSREVLVVDFRRSEERGLRQADAELGGHRPVVGHHVKGV